MTDRSFHYHYHDMDSQFQDLLAALSERNIYSRGDLERYEAAVCTWAPWYWVQQCGHLHAWGLPCSSSASVPA